MKPKVLILEMSDEFECETCGWSCAHGFHIEIDGIEYDNLHPFAACFDEISYNEKDLMEFLSSKLGFEVDWSWEE